MPNYCTVAEGHQFNYPADATSFKIILAAGGRSKLSNVDKAKVKYKTVKEGEDCSDMPPVTLALYIERGWVIESAEKIWNDLSRSEKEIIDE